MDFDVMRDVTSVFDGASRRYRGGRPPRGRKHGSHATLAQARTAADRHRIQAAIDKRLRKNQRRLRLGLIPAAKVS